VNPYQFQKNVFKSTIFSNIKRSIQSEQKKGSTIPYTLTVRVTTPKGITRQSFLQEINGIANGTRIESIPRILLALNRPFPSQETMQSVVRRGIDALIGKYAIQARQPGLSFVRAPFI